MPLRKLLIGLAALGVVLTATVVPGVFTIDENHYLVSVTALREGRLTVPGTEGLTASRELRWFDPAGAYQRVEETPVSPSVPPLYAPLALPFALLGWRGLVFLNTLAYLAATLLVALYARRYSTHPWAPWTAAAAFALGGYSIEYAQGVWPHMVTAALIAGAAYLTAQVRDGEGWERAVGAGLLAGLAAGVRYQNVFLAGCLGFGVLLWARRRWSASLAYGVGCAVPLSISSLLNHLRLGSWNPVSKGPGYISMPTPSAEGNLVTDTLRMAWARIGDFSTRPPLTGTDHVAYLRPDPVTGAYQLLSAVKKAWLQSAPWLALALVALLLAWVTWRRADESAERTRRRELRALSLIVFPTLGLFAASGILRTDGLSFNQRYFIELLPLAAVALAWALPPDRWLSVRGTAAGAALGVLAAALAVAPLPGDPVRQIALMYVPLLIVLALLLSRTLYRSTAIALSLTLGLSLGWALGAHVGDDLAASRQMRASHLGIAEQLDGHLPQRASLVTWWGNKDAVGPLLLDRDLVVLDVRNDAGAKVQVLAAELEARGYPLYLIANGMPRPIIEALLRDRDGRRVSQGPILLVELEPRPGN